jgi:copper chaperone NosL
MKHALLALLLLLPACREETVAIPDPTPLTDQALSFFCQMNVAEHAGPKGQVHLSGFTDPIFFAQVRDLVAYLKSPERDARITAIYVSDMGAARSWAEPGEANWIAADGAHFVVGAGVAGGMGAPEIVPFGLKVDAEGFVERHGGTTMPLSQIPDDAALGAVDLDADLEQPS